MRTYSIFAMFCLASGIVPSLALPSDNLPTSSRSTSPLKLFRRKHGPTLRPEVENTIRETANDVIERLLPQWENLSPHERRQTRRFMELTAPRLAKNDHTVSVRAQREALYGQNGGNA
ncbi:hypothetical protein F5148DRAFT_1225237 [Russula earlei]|uniref:Uncharacterized protein n=1 Tax=Russula earlei TaxID=71964 RepID=A0ACC0U1X6_9AGAM|nr:hypothetical protein F5148DRAFT_1225237 [Russula earlei]